ncbi:hypothetical protein [Streptomyces sp. NPDC056883]|uniref:hypothetical protein n=1 Tax=Streptomyces sp. NPDC056883 TaxID=3345959 RepID=UPI0036BBB75C
MLDTAPRLASPWPAWPDSPGSGLASVPADQPFTPAQVLAAASRSRGPAGDWAVLTDHREWSHGPLDLPAEPAAWYQLASGGGWQAAVADTCHPMAHDIVAARTQGLPGLSAAWCSLPFAVPVLCAPTTGSGVAALQTAVKAASAEGLPLQRMVVALTATGEGRLPAAAKAAATMLQSLVSAVVVVPFDPHIRIHGMAQSTRLGRRTAEAGAALVAAVLASAHRTWGNPLPPAPVPAGLPTESVPVRPAQPALEGVLTP